MDLARAYLARVLGGLVAGASVWIADVLGTAWAPAQDEQAALTGVLVAIAFMGYSVVHRFVDSWLNPADAAAPEKVVIPEAVPK